MMKHLRISPKYRTTTPYMIGFYVLIFIGVFLILGYLFEFLRIGVVLQIYPEFYSHVSNLSISIIAFLGIGLSWMIQGVKFKYITLLGAALTVANVLCETVMAFMNTTDLVDASYGVIGIAISFVYLMIIFKHGLILVEEKQADKNSPKI